MYSIGDNVLAKIGYSWVPATITKPKNKQGNYGIRFKAGKKTINYLANDEQLRLTCLDSSFHLAK